MLADKDEDGRLQDPLPGGLRHLRLRDAAFADLVLPDTSYLERHDVLSMLDRPISEFDGPVDSVRIPVLPPKGECKPFQEVLIELGSRLKLPAFVTPGRQRKYRDYPDFIVNYETSPGSGIGFLAGWRGKGGEKFLKGEPNPRQWEMYAQNGCVYHHELPRTYQYMRNWNKGYLHWARAHPHDPLRRAHPAPSLLRGAAALPPRRAGQGPGRQPPERLAQRVETYFDPLPFYYEPLESQRHRHPALSAQRADPAAHGHVPLLGQPERLAAPDPQPQLPVRQPPGRRAPTASATATGSGSSRPGQGALHVPLLRGGGARHRLDLERHRQGGRAPGAWPPDADESRKGFLLNHLISEELPPRAAAASIVQLRPGHRPGRLVRRAGAGYKAGARRAGQHQRPVRSSSAGCRRATPGMAGRVAGRRCLGAHEPPSRGRAPPYPVRRRTEPRP